jgi:hypothetical protein
MKIDLPEPIDKIVIPGRVNQGELTITKYEDQFKLQSFPLNLW